MTEELEAERWKKIRKIYEEALELSGAERESYLASSCSGDETLRPQVTRLLQAYENNPEFLETPLLLEVEPPDYHPVEQRLGAYRLVRRLGSGGMGVVYLAERDDGLFSFRVAIKIVWPISPIIDLPERFARERQIVASLNHPNISRLIDGGVTPDGLPFMVLEYIEGERINHYCEQRRLPVETRLRIFREACLAVAHVHQQRIVHRDLKPGNILVTADGRVKLLDFGIARVLESDESRQQVHIERTVSPLLTYHYASPEQIRGERVGAASDIYALGVILYELIEGHLPYELALHSPLQVIRTITEVNPAPVEKGGSPWMSHQLDGLVRRAMSKRVEERYPSVEALTEDLDALLSGREIHSVVDVAAGGVRRSPYLVPIFLLALIILTVVGWQLWRRFAEQRSAIRYEKLSGQVRWSLEQGKYLEARQLLQTIESDPELKQRADVELGRLALRVAAPIILKQAEGVDQSLVVNQGKMLLTTSGNYSNLNLWDIASQRLLKTIERKGQRLWAMTNIEEPYDLNLLLRTGGTALEVEDILSGRVIATCPSPAVVTGAVLWKGKVYSIDQKGVLRKWELASCQSEVIVQLPLKKGSIIDFPYNLPLVIRLDASSMTIWNLTSGKRLAKIKENPDQTPPGNINLYQISNDLRHLVLHRFPNRVEIYNLLNGSLLKMYEEPDTVRKIFIDSLNSHLITIHDNDRIKVRQLLTGRVLKAYNLGEDITDAVMTDDNRWLFAGTVKGVLAVIDLQQDGTSGVIGRRQVHPRPGELHLRMDGLRRRVIVSGGDGTVGIWSLDQLLEPTTITRIPNEEFMSLAISPNGTKMVIATKSNKFHLLNLVTRKLEEQVSKQAGKADPAALAAWIYDASFSPDGKMLATGGADNQVVIWDFERRQPVYKRTLEAQVVAVGFSPDGRQIAAATNGGHIDLLTAANDWSVRRLGEHRFEATCLAWSPDGKLIASGGSDGLVRLWDPQGMAQIGQLTGQGQKVLAIAISPDGRTIAARRRDSFIRLYDLKTGRERLAIPNASEGRFDMRFTPDSSKLIFPGDDSTIRIVEVRGGRELLRLAHPGSVIQTLTLSPDGKLLFTGSDKNLVEVHPIIEW
jgi:serine/threonine protein kinase/WD40 repeat protein